MSFKRFSSGRGLRTSSTKKGRDLRHSHVTSKVRVIWPQLAGGAAGAAGNGRVNFAADDKANLSRVHPKRSGSHDKKRPRFGVCVGIGGACHYRIAHARRKSHLLWQWGKCRPSESSRRRARRSVSRKSKVASR